MKFTGEACPPFRFKHFSAFHHRSSMKIGVDGVLLGAWASVKGKRGLDVGCGCGLIALMCAQRNPVADILAVDFHHDSVDEASLNFILSPWNRRLKVLYGDVFDLYQREGEMMGNFDFIVSNPPFFHSGIANPSTPREKARHESRLSPHSLLVFSERFLNSDGSVSFIMPAECLGPFDSPVFLPSVLSSWFNLAASSLSLRRVCVVQDRPSVKPKRLMVEFGKSSFLSSVEVDSLCLREENGSYSQDYRNLTKDFYLAF